MKSIPERLQSVTGLALILNGLAQWEFVLFDPLHQVPWVLVGFRDLLNASIKEYPLCLACGAVERLPLPGGPVLLVLANSVSALLLDLLLPSSLILVLNSTLLLCLHALVALLILPGVIGRRMMTR
jgi:hypothetical protein